MSTNDHLPNPFATALRSAIRASGLSLDGIVRRLAVKGNTISAGALSQWQSGRTSPARADSLRAIGHLEEVLGLERNALRCLVKSPFLRGRPIRESRMAPIASGYVHADRVRELAAKVDMSWAEKLMRLSQHDRIQVGSDRAQESLLIKQVLRATHDGPDRFVAVVWFDQDQPVPTLVAVRGCELGQIVVDRPARALVAELMFERPLERGETVVIEHQFLWMTPPPDGTVDHYRRSLRTQVRECLIEVDFHPDMLPIRCEEVFRPEGRPDLATRRTLELDSTGRVHAVAVRDGPGDLGIHWEWDPAVC